MLSLRLSRPLSSRSFSSSAFALAHHRVVVVGAGTAGVTVAAQLPRAGSAVKASDIALLDPSATHSCAYPFLARASDIASPNWTDRRPSLSFAQTSPGGRSSARASRAFRTCRSRRARLCQRARLSLPTRSRRSSRSATPSRPPAGRKSRKSHGTVVHLHGAGVGASEGMREARLMEE